MSLALFGQLSTPEMVMIVVILATVLILVGALMIIIKCYRKVEQGRAIIRNGMGGTRGRWGEVRVRVGE